MSGFIRTAFFLGDWFFLNLSILVSNYLYFNALLGHDRVNGVYLIIYSNLAWFFLVLVSNPYSVSRSWFFSAILKSQLAFLFIHLLIVASLVYIFKKSYDPFQIVLIYVFFAPLFFAGKAAVLYMNHAYSKNLDRSRNYILLGRNKMAREIRRYFLMNTDLHYRFYGYYELDPADTEINEIRQVCLSHDVHEIYCCIPRVDEIRLKRLVDFGLDSLIQVRLIPDNRFQYQKLIQLEKFDQLPPGNMVTITLDEPRYRFLKRSFDILFSLWVILFILSWLTPLLALLIKMDSKGPVFFVQLRSGQNDEQFKCIKFRTMFINKEADTHQAIKDDPRITRLGSFLRRTCLDEFPQFINVFLGSMSVVGPRPYMLRHREEYAKVIDKFMGRHYVKPGVTGQAQCMGYRGEIKNLADMENRVRLDRRYIETWSFWLDIKIIFLTIVTIIRGD
jgi:undecaprenyl-phosphate galactose phosphotransferase/putative colanic acid biosynthesis UDP-glucose lipid carrier transferase